MLDHIPLLLLLLMGSVRSSRAEFGSRIFQQELIQTADPVEMDLGLAKSIEIQRRAFLSVMQPYVSRPEEAAESSSDQYQPEFLRERAPGGHLNKDSTIHLRVLRSPGRSFRLRGSSAFANRRRTPINPPRPAEDSSTQLGPVVLEVTETEKLPHNVTGDGQVIINNVPMLERRSIPQLGGMVTLYTRNSPLRLLYYGNWCGSGGMGNPLDEIDRCCMTHDKCYGTVEKQPCLVFIQKPYSVHYAWRWVDERKQAYCLRTGDKCGELTCECDRVAAECFSKFVIDAKLVGKRLRKHKSKDHPLRGQH